MPATPFNPLAARHSRESGNRELKAAGIEAEHAEAIAEGMREAADAAGADRGDLATKGDIAALRAGAKAGLADLENRLRADLATKADLEALRSELRWMLAFQAAIILAIAAKAVRHRLTTGRHGTERVSAAG